MKSGALARKEVIQQEVRRGGDEYMVNLLNSNVVDHPFRRE
jgi:hypothetical protein